MKSGRPNWPNPLSSHPRWCPWDLLRSFKICSDAKEREVCGKQREATAPIHLLVKLQPRFMSLQWKTWLWAELQPWCLSLQWRTCPWAEHDDDDEYIKLWLGSVGLYLGDLGTVHAGHKETWDFWQEDPQTFTCAYKNKWRMRINYNNELSQI